MSKEQQFGCKKCGGVITVEGRALSDRLEFRVSDGRFYERYKALELQCKKCGRAVATVTFDPS